MKKIVTLLVLVMALSSCSEDITRNSPSFQGLKNDVLWRSAGTTATFASNGVVTITGSRQLETLILKTNSITAQTYTLGTSGDRRAVFITNIDGEEITYSTNVGRGDGQITITEYDAEAQTISGTFRFNAVNDTDDTETDILNFQSGVFYKVPIVPAQ